MGEPDRGHARSLPAEHIGWSETTWETETSKYPEEEKSTEIPGVAASETGPSLNPCKRSSVSALLHVGLWDHHLYETYLIDVVTKRRGSKTVWKGRPERVKAPYTKLRRLR